MSKKNILKPVKLLTIEEVDFNDKKQKIKR
jgi:hypothetical protein